MVRFAVPRLPLSLLDARNPAHFPAIVRTLKAGQRAVEEVVAERAVRRLLAFWALPSGYWALRAARKRGIPFSTWALGSDIWTLGRIPVVRGILRKVLREAEHCFADGIGLCGDVQRISGRECRFLPSCRRLEAPRQRPLSSNPPYRLAFIGRWHRNKGADLLLDALERLTDEDWCRIECVRIAGGGPLERLVLQRAARLVSAGRPVQMLGFVDRRAAAQLLDWTDYVLIPSRLESIPLIFSDAMQAHRPVICTPAGDLPSLLDQYRVGVLAPEVDMNAFVAALRSGLSLNPTSFGSEFERACGDFDVSVRVHRLLSWLDEAPSPS